MKVIGEDIVAPNCMHHLFLTKFAVNFSEAEILGPAVDKKKLPWSDYVEICLFHKKSKTLIVTDLFFNWHNFNNWIETAFAKINGGYKKLAMTRMAKFSFKDKASLRALAQKIEAWNPQNIIVAHGEVIIENAVQLLKEPLSKLRAI
ncbi:MAG: hypothetical protein H7326_02630 [Bdellovibrionaceae bacterium]|nr:hypothetical protein [Pseudobdellovibrionaceae bacterium]